MHGAQASQLCTRPVGYLATAGCRVGGSGSPGRGPNRLSLPWLLKDIGSWAARRLPGAGGAVMWWAWRCGLPLRRLSSSSTTTWLQDLREFGFVEPYSVRCTGKQSGTDCLFANTGDWRHPWRLLQLLRGWGHLSPDVVGAVFADRSRPQVGLRGLPPRLPLRALWQLGCWTLGSLTPSSPTVFAPPPSWS